jgi:hypothetical protein
MQPLCEIWITTYEVSDNGLSPVLSHVFYGSTLDEAYGYAKSHMITDFFFSSSFLGKMPWRNSVIEMTNRGKVIDMNNFEHPEKVQQLLSGLSEKAQKVNSDQYKSGMVLAIQEVARAN